ncbi:MAG: hypothetical protein QM490_05530 [Candidatus Gracilibacteria bacterium]
MIGFQLGREYKLSIAEILSVFPEGKTVNFDTNFLILDNVTEEKILEKANNLGGTIKIVKICECEIENEWISNITKEALKSEGKFKYGLSVFGKKINLKKILISQKKELKANKISSRFINKDFKNLNSAQITGEKLIFKKTDFNYLYTSDNVYFGIGIWVQNINEYSKRDYSKDRDMQTGMLPPKLCQMMLNLAGGEVVYDPFVGLGTILIESILMGNKKVYGSDLSDRMIEKTSNNINSFIETNNLSLDDSKIIKLNAKFIDESEILLEKNIDSIVTEGYLGEIMTQKNISHERIDKQKKSLIELYNRYFEGLTKINYKGNLIMCFPFWEMKGKYIYFSEIYDVIKKYCIIDDLFPVGLELDPTKAGSLLYKREKQLVGREIFKLRLR